MHFWWGCVRDLLTLLLTFVKMMSAPVEVKLSSNKRASRQSLTNLQGHTSRIGWRPLKTAQPCFACLSPYKAVCREVKLSIASSAINAQTLCWSANHDHKLCRHASLMAFRSLRKLPRIDSLAITCNTSVCKACVHHRHLAWMCWVHISSTAHAMQ